MDMMRFVRICEAIAATTKKLEKTALVADYLRSLSILSGRPFPDYEDLDSAYTPGRRGKSWLRMRLELATLDVVVTNAPAMPTRSKRFGKFTNGNRENEPTFARQCIWPWCSWLSDSRSSSTGITQPWAVSQKTCSS